MAHAYVLNVQGLAMLTTDQQQDALDLINDYGGIDGAHHKQWLLDQLVRILAYDYDEWVIQFNYGDEGAHTYEWDEGIAP